MVPQAFEIILGKRLATFDSDRVYRCFVHSDVLGRTAVEQASFPRYLELAWIGDNTLRIDMMASYIMEPTANFEPGEDDALAERLEAAELAGGLVPGSIFAPEFERHAWKHLDVLGCVATSGTLVAALRAATLTRDDDKRMPLDPAAELEPKWAKRLEGIPEHSLREHLTNFCLDPKYSYNVGGSPKTNPGGVKWLAKLPGWKLVTAWELAGGALTVAVFLCPTLGDRVAR